MKKYVDKQELLDQIKSLSITIGGKEMFGKDVKDSVVNIIESIGTICVGIDISCPQNNAFIMNLGGSMLELNKIYNMDCVDGMRLLDDDCIDLTVTSPPYDNLRTYNGNIEQWSFDKFQAISKELYRVTKQGGVVVWVVGDATVKGSETGTSFKQALWFMNCGFNLHDTMIYRKTNYAPLTHNRYEQEFEYMFVFSKGKPKTFNPIKIPCKTAGAKTSGRTFYQTNNQNTPTAGHKNNPVSACKQKGNVWELSTNAGAKGHPAQFPEQLAQDHIITWSNPGDVIFDPFLGSGTTAKMAVLNDRHYIGFELSEEYCKIANDRIKS